MRSLPTVCVRFALSLVLLTSCMTRTEKKPTDLKRPFAGEPVEVILDAFNQEQAWGLCTTIDLHGCKKIMNQSKENEEYIKQFVIELCELIDMNRYGAPDIPWFGTDEIQGYTMIQLIETSCISAHWADDRMFFDLFSCKFYDPYKVIKFTKKWFESDDVSVSVCIRY